MLENLLYNVYKKPMEDLLSVDSSTLSSYLREIKNDKDIWNIANQVYTRKVRKGVKNFFPLYVICRETKPQNFIETGVGNGVSTSFILKSMEMNQKGSLYSIDFQTDRYKEFMSGKEVGWIVPNYLRGRWKLSKGKSREVLPKLLKKLDKIQGFLHDSSHDYNTMLFEFDSSWSKIEDDGFLLSDDVNRNSAFDDFAKVVGSDPYPISHFSSGDKLGSLRKENI